MKVKFTKMHGLGNDFVLFDLINNKELMSITALQWSDLSRKLCDRRFGIGADQMLLLSEADNTDFSMRIFNCDGSEIEMCGNGIRCFAKYVWDSGLSEKETLSIETLAGIIKPKKAGIMVSVDMGMPEFEGRKIPVDMDGKVIDHSLDVEGSVFTINCVSMGNQHAVIFVDNTESYPVERDGRLLETNKFFPKRTNVEFIQVLRRDEIKMRVWERGAGETLACGTGACASVAASAYKGLTDKKVLVHLRGGELDITWDEVSGHIFMTGPAVTVFTGEINIEI
ncbi:MAG: diaminopimelate epimerase [Nitrospirae bacterium]|nr:diaminopimelate epimerase [Nitrospirota bacterium]MBF0535278.1 diaminopimelate epimerase [Nitrospirota bacterium]MBF0617299.1 diaminopimelate epimerase [Nitrospirota bacterium]